MIYLASFGMTDPVHVDIIRTLNLIKTGTEEQIITEKGQIRVRLVSGDHVLTCTHVA